MNLQENCICWSEEENKIQFDYQILFFDDDWKLILHLKKERKSFSFPIDLVFNDPDSVEKYALELIDLMMGFVSS